MAGMVRVESERGQEEDRMRYLSVCSGIEAATVAWHPLGWEAAAYSEIEAFPSAVLAHHYPDVQNLGDMTKYKEWDSGRIGAVDVLVGGTPCQSFSIAGLRKGLEDPRGSLMLTYLGIAASYRPRWVVWENVPGVLSSNGGRDFGSFLGALGHLGYEWSYRVLDAQWFGLAQRRKRVFVVGHLGNSRHSAKVLFKSESLQRHNETRRRSQEEASSNAQGSIRKTSFAGNVESDVAACLQTTCDDYSRADGFNMIVEPVCKCFYASDARKKGTVDLHDQVKTLTSQAKRGDTEPCVVCEPSMCVRRLTPRECERLQGFPDHYTMIQWRKKPAGNCPDGPRYKALGNSMAVPVMHWIGKRIAEVEAHG